MTYSVYIRPLCPEDALVSWQWRNNPKLWRWTGGRPDRYITPEIERAWIEEVLERKNEKRFAICLPTDDRYIGNIYLTDIHDGGGQLHIFIGDMASWGGGRAAGAICCLLEYAFDTLGLQVVHSTIMKGNLVSLALSSRVGFRQVSDDEQYIRQVFTREMYEQGVHLGWTQDKKNQIQPE